MPFLTAEWRKLAFANYLVDPEVLKPFVPWGTELDLWQGKCYVSLVGFMFMHTRLRGIRVPFHVNFEEVNLRFYVRRKDGVEWKRGVVFIREFVPKPALTWVANTIYGENYATVPMRHRWEAEATHLKVAYHWKKEGRWHQFVVEAENEPKPIEPGSEAEFITEHYWGYARQGDKSTNEYEVKHPTWLQYAVEDYNLEVDYGQLYGKAFEPLNGQGPASVMLAEGSAVSVESKRQVR